MYNGTMPSKGNSLYLPTLRERVQLLFAEKKLRGRFEILNAINSLSCCGIFLVERYFPLAKSVTELTLWSTISRAYALCDLLIMCYVEENNFTYLLSFSGVVDLATSILPTLLAIAHFVSQNTFEDASITDMVRVLSSLRLLRTAKWLRYQVNGHEYSKELLSLLVTILATAFCATGVFQVFESPWYEENTGFRLSFHDALYFVVVTAGTVGYGDVTPKTLGAKFLVMAYILAIVTYLPKQLAILASLAQNKHSYDGRCQFRRSDLAAGHVMVTGYVSAESVNSFLHEFTSPGRGRNRMKVIILSTQPPSAALKSILRKEKYCRAVTFLKGSVLEDEDLDRCHVSHAQAVFILGNAHAYCSEQVDTKAVMQALAIRSYAQSRRISMIPTFAQLMQADNRLTAYGMLGTDQTVFVSWLKNGMLALNTVCPGACALIGNLIRSYDTKKYKKDGFLEAEWLKEYSEGLEYQIYPMLLNASFHGEQCSAAINRLYDRFGVLLFALYIRGEQTASRIEFAPFGRKLEEGMLSLVIAKDMLTVHDVLMAYSASNSRDEFQTPACVVDVPGSSRAAQSASTNTGSTRRVALQREYSTLSRWAVVDKSTLIRRQSPCKISRRSIYALKLVSSGEDCDRSALSDHSSSTKDLAVPQLSCEANNEMLDTKLSDLCFDNISRSGRQPKDYNKAVRYADTVNDLSGHIVVCGHLPQSQHLIEALRVNLSMLSTRSTTAKKSEVPIVVLSPDDLQRLQFPAAGESLGEVVYVQGSALVYADLVRAGVERAQRVIVIAQCCGDGVREEQELPVADFDTIMALYAIEDIYMTYRDESLSSSTANARGRFEEENTTPDDNYLLRTIIALKNPRSVRFCRPWPQPGQGGRCPYVLTPAFAAGGIYVDTHMDSLLCQAFFNPYMIQIVNGLVHGCGGSSDHRFIRGHQQDAPTTFLARVPWTRLYKKRAESADYGSIFLGLTEKQMLPLGVYRHPSSIDSAESEYVYTNPPKTAVIYPEDKVFVITTRKSYTSYMQSAFYSSP